MHAAIFLGFCALLVRKLHLIVIGYDALAVIPGAAGAAYAAFKDFVELAVLVAVAYAFWRRFVHQAAAPGAQPRGDPDPVADRGDRRLGLPLRRPALRDLRRRPGHRARAGLRAGGRGRGLGIRGRSRPASLAFGLHASYWLQMVTVFSFLVLLPLGEHFHIVTALPARVPRPRHAGEPRALRRPREIMADDAGEDMKVGAKTAADLAVEGSLRCLHLHRVRPLQGFLPDLPHRQAAGDEVGQRRPQAPPAGQARGDRRRQDEELPRARAAR